MDVPEQRIVFSHRPAFLNSGSPAFLIPKKTERKNEEMVLGVKLVCDRWLFGRCCQILLGDYFYAMPHESGVFLAPFVPSNKILEDLAFPGDIDILVIPYEGNELIVSHTLVIELKIVRASFKKQGKSPVRFGFSQAMALLDRGFPLAAVIHVITSNGSPEGAWRECDTAKVINAESGKIEMASPRRMDLLPHDLIKRSLGRLLTNRSDDCIGIVSTYASQAGRGVFLFPSGVAALPNPVTDLAVLEAIADFFNSHYNSFLATPRY